MTVETEWEVDIPEAKMPAPPTPPMPTWLWSTKPMSVIDDSVDGGEREFIGFRLKDEGLSEEVREALDAAGCELGIIHFEGGSQEAHWLAEMLEILPLTRGFQTLEHVGSDRRLVEDAVKHNAKLLPGEKEKTAADVLERFGIALGYAPVRDSDGAIKYNAEGKPIYRSFHEIPFFLRRVVPCADPSQTMDLYVPMRMSFRSTLTDDSIAATAKHAELLQTLKGDKAALAKMGEVFDAYVATLPEDREVPKKALRYHYASMVWGKLKSGKKKAKNENGSAPVQIPGLRVKTNKETGAVDSAWLRERIVTVDELLYIEDALDKLHEWALNRSFRKMDPTERTRDDE